MPYITETEYQNLVQASIRDDERIAELEARVEKLEHEASVILYLDAVVLNDAKQLDETEFATVKKQVKKHAPVIRELLKG